MSYDFGTGRFQKRAHPSSCRWGTEDEIDFLRRLGTHTLGQPKNIKEVRKSKRLELLRIYKDSMKNRVDWGHIDPKRILVALYEMISELEALP